MLIELLRGLQGEKGYLTDEDMKAAARRADVPLYRIEEVVSFYAHFRRTPPPHVLVQVCRDMSCHLRGSAQMIEECKKAPGVTVEGVSCLGRCDRAPACVASVHGAFHDRLYLGRTPAQMRAVAGLVAGGKAPPADTDAVLKDESGRWNINCYRRDPSRPRFAVALKLIDELGDEDRLAPLAKDDVSSVRGRWLERLKLASVLGMGGGGAPAAGKWRDVARQPGRPSKHKHVVANGDESEPGTFKDRDLMLRCPELVVEGVILACLLTGAGQGHVFIRHEYPEQAEAIQGAIDEARELKACGPGLPPGMAPFDVEVFVSPGGYICGEQSALLEAMEGRRAQPRDRPPQLSAVGLHGMPTLVNNVETLAWAPAVFLNGPEWYAKEKGWRLFSISGDVEHPGVYELATTAKLGDLLDRAKVKGNLQAVATSGPSGGFVPAMLNGQDIRTMPLDLNYFRGAATKDYKLKRGILLGAGLVVYNDTRDMLSEAVNCTEFFCNESCGKCVPCRLGAEKLLQVGYARQGKQPGGMSDDDIYDLHSAMTFTSICALGVSAGAPLTSYLDYFKPRG